ncbi:hypothetical protein M2324_000276 [Rhodovulum sulfidophilum]|nr:hypothetical protein [Rhodovulum sulfidophilum]
MLQGGSGGKASCVLRRRPAAGQRGGCAVPSWGLVTRSVFWVSSDGTTCASRFRSPARPAAPAVPIRPPGICRGEDGDGRASRQGLVALQAAAGARLLMPAPCPGTGPRVHRGGRKTGLGATSLGGQGTPPASGPARSRFATGGWRSRSGGGRRQAAGRPVTGAPFRSDPEGAAGAHESGQPSPPGRAARLRLAILSMTSSLLRSVAS